METITTAITITIAIAIGAPLVYVLARIVAFYVREHRTTTTVAPAAPSSDYDVLVLVNRLGEHASQAMRQGFYESIMAADAIEAMADCGEPNAEWLVASGATARMRDPQWYAEQNDI